MKCINAVAVHDFTLTGAATEDHQEIIKALKGIAKKWIFQLEISDEGYVHWQGRMSLIKKRRCHELHHLFVLQKSVMAKAHFTPTCKATLEDKDALWAYSDKLDTHVDGPWSSDDKEPAYVPRQVREAPDLRPFQKTILANIGVWDTRTINLVYCEKGNNGKSTLLSHIVAHGLGVVPPTVNDAKDLLRMVYAMPGNFYCFDMPRAMKKESMFGFWSAVETIKDGRAYDDRYTYRQRLFDCPNIWVFTNTLPDLGLMSRDRWKIWTISDTFELCEKVQV